MSIIKDFLLKSLANLDSKLHPINEDIQFINFDLPDDGSATRKSYQAASNDATKIKLAKEMPPHFKQSQIDELGAYYFSHCPGMLDFSRLGYIIPCWTTYEFLYNSAGISIYEGSSDTPNRQKTPIRSFDPKVFHNTILNDDGSPPKIYNLTSPWQIRCKPGLHMIVLPPIYHGTLHRDFHLLPGIIDYGKGFHTINLLTGPKRYGRFKINIGEPLFHVIPIKEDNFTAAYGYTDSFKNPPGRGESHGFLKNFYRKYHRSAIKYKLKKQEVF